MDFTFFFKVSSLFQFLWCWLFAQTINLRPKHVKAAWSSWTQQHMGHIRCRWDCELLFSCAPNVPYFYLNDSTAKIVLIISGTLSARPQGVWSEGHANAHTYTHRHSLVTNCDLVLLLYKVSSNTAHSCNYPWPW